MKVFMRVKRIKSFRIVAWSIVNVTSVGCQYFLVLILIYYYLDMKHGLELGTYPIYRLDFILLFYILDIFILKLIDFVFKIRYLIWFLYRWDSEHILITILARMEISSTSISLYINNVKVTQKLGSKVSLSHKIYLIWLKIFSNTKFYI